MARKANRGGLVKKQVTVRRKGKTIKQMRMVKANKNQPSRVGKVARAVGKGLLAAGAVAAIGAAGIIAAKGYQRGKYAARESGLSGNAARMGGLRGIGKAFSNAGRNLPGMAAAGIKRGVARSGVSGAVKGAASSISMGAKFAAGAARIGANAVKSRVGNTVNSSSVLRGMAGSLKGHQSFGSGARTEHNRRVGLHG